MKDVRVSSITQTLCGSNVAVFVMTTLSLRGWIKMSKTGICENPKCPYVDRKRLADPSNMTTLHLIRMNTKDFSETPHWLCANCEGKYQEGKITL
jgi:hypothetical protein